MSKTPSFPLLIAISSLLALTPSCKKAEYRSSEGVNWNTTYHVTYLSSRSLDDSIVTAMKRVEDSLSPFNPASVISAVNRGDSDSIDSRIALLFEASQRVNRLSGGMFDPTVAPLINLWGFGYDNVSVEPTQAQIDSALTLVGIADCRIVNSRIMKKNDGTQFNFSAITKGYGCDEVGRSLESAGCNDYMVEIGGEIALKGKNPRGTLWNVMVDAPIEDRAGAHEGLSVIQATDCGIATSGNYRNYRDTSSGRIGHTISPITGRPVKSEILSTTIIAPTCMEADALATASMALPLIDATAMIENLGEGYSAMFVTANPDSTWNIISTSRFPELKM